MHRHPAAETIETRGCSIVLRRVEGPQARELFLLCRPPGEGVAAGLQAEAVYRAILDVLEAEGGDLGAVVCETVFLRDLRRDLEPVRAARESALDACGGPPWRPALTEVEQPPLNEGARLEVSLQAVLPLADGSPFTADPLGAGCARPRGLRVHLGQETRLYAGGLYGAGEDAYEQTLSMFGVAEDLLRQAGMEFRDVVRTWIHLAEMDRDYAGLNRARREFFEARGIDPAPASTGIGGVPASEDHALCLGLYALERPGAVERSPMSAPTLNEAPLYGSDFARGMRVVETNKIALHVSGTASIDEAGRTAHPDDFEAQAARMLLNVSALLEGQGAGFGDVVSAVTYLSRRGDAARLREKLREAGFDGFPNALVEAPICRPDLLCEVEALAVLPKRPGIGR